MFEFKILAKQKGTKARTASFHTPHGKLMTPELAIVATEGEIKAIPKEIMNTLPIQLIVVNTFHLWIKKINPNNNLTIKQFNNNIHDFSNFPRVIMSDSGGFQVFSLGFGKAHGVGKVANIFPGEFVESAINPQKTFSLDENNPLKVFDQGVEFVYNDKKWLLTPEKSIELQHRIGADIIFAFDECTSPLNSKEYTSVALERTHDWLLRCVKTHRQLDQALFGIIQGGEYEDLRIKSAKFVAKQSVSGFGIGGSLGKTKADVFKVLDWVIPHLPDNKPRHLLGIGQVKDMLEAIERGVDLFDCVIPTREARHKVLYTQKGKINLRKVKHLGQFFDKSCSCPACKEKITFKKLYELFLQKDPRAFFFATIHNIYFFSSLTKRIRETIALGKFIELKEEILKYY